MDQLPNVQPGQAAVGLEIASIYLYVWEACFFSAVELGNASSDRLGD